ncbi:MDR family MFS transporter [Deinococcus yavapaiensis]|uniref:EmrB/QacA subfamily drug resistance transporter n=1 Tax=Deinococcus yavapaiensis KR-236 TaxID=694435 RepID=A0A318SND9_9DEIO|nr:MDR family MFS transporter [Deinococcus yavapaiensis]PYE54159.1 EmrB/QacA subfamily drug resistance transporter [Deinococcus yavapaiensis KR-236]
MSATYSSPSDALTPQVRLLTLVGIMLALLLGALDQTIVATAGPAIQRDLAIPPSLYTWLTIAYLVTSTVVVPIYGKLGDLYGRKPVILFGLTLFLVASVLCGLAGSATHLILLRAVQGLGAGALFTTAFAIVADLYPPAERARVNGALGGVFGLSSVLGPLVGGAITDTWSWHWVFFVNVPVGLVALVFIATRMPLLRNANAGGRVDYAGALWLIVASVPLLLALSLGKTHPQPGETAFAWTSWPILTMFALFAVGLAAFIATERRAPEPLLDLALFKNRTFAVANLAIFVLGAGFLASIVFLPLFMVNVVGLSATNSGLTTTPLTFGLIASAIVGGALTTRFGRYKPVMLVSLVILLAGFAIMGFTLTSGSTQLEVTLKMIVVGLGLGAVVSLYSLAVQNALPPERTGVATSAVSFFQQMGGTVGLAVLGTVFAGNLQTNLTAAASKLPPALTAERSPRQASGTFDARAVRADLRESFADQRDLYTAALRSGDAHAARVLAASASTPNEARVLLTNVANGTAPRAARLAALPPTLRGLEAAEERALADVTRFEGNFKDGWTDAITLIYRLGLLIVALGLLVTALLPELPLRKADPSEAPTIMG